MHADLFFRRLQRRGQKFAANHFSPVQIIVFYYILTMVLSLVLFYMSIFREPDSRVSFADMLFMVISIVSVIGLSTFNINSVFNNNGIIPMEILFQIGGLGIMIIPTASVTFSKRRITLKQRQLIMTDMNQPRLSGIVRLIRITFTILIWFQLLFGTFFSIYFYYRGYFDHWHDTVFYGFYQAISVVTNSGFDVTGDSIKSFAHDYFFLILIMFLTFVGGIGFPVLMECREWLLYKRPNAKPPFRFSLFTKLAVLAFVILFVSGTISTYPLEKDCLFQDSNMSVKWTNSMFYSITTCNAGLQIHDLGDFRITTLIIFSLLMLIGCSSSPVGGGIRTTTVAIIGLCLYSFLKSEDNINIFGRRADQDNVRKSVVVFILSLGMCFFYIVFLSATEEQTLISIIVEVTSAFGTTGLSLGITGDLSVVGEIAITTLMFIGRIGMLYTLMLFAPKETRDLGYEYPSEKIITG